MPRWPWPVDCVLKARSSPHSALFCVREGFRRRFTVCSQPGRSSFFLRSTRLGEPTSSAQQDAGESTAATGLENAHYHAQPSSSGAEAERWGFENANYVPLSDDFFSSAPGVVAGPRPRIRQRPLVCACHAQPTLRFRGRPGHAYFPRLPEDDELWRRAQHAG